MCTTNNIARKRSVIIKKLARVNVWLQVKSVSSMYIDSIDFSSFKTLDILSLRIFEYFVSTSSLETAAFGEFNLMMIVVKIFSLLCAKQHYSIQNVNGAESIKIT